MKLFSRRHLTKWILASFLLVIVSSCSSINYYGQAISGHIDLVSRERPIDDVLADAKTPEKLKQKLLLAKKARLFASKELLLPDNDSYKTYADLERDSAVWNVVATPAYSVKPKTWCFLIVGCLAYRGYFDKLDAISLAKELKQDGLDVQVSGAWAYSTLGYFDDPLLNTMIGHSDASLVGVIFHELAHQVIYISGDSAFNEAFATAVEQEGLRRWFEQLGDANEYQAYLKQKQLRHQFYSLLKQTREQLNLAFDETADQQQKQGKKLAIYARLQADYREWSERNNFHAYDKFMQRDLNNAHLALIATYQDLVPNFLNILDSVNGDLDRFYKVVAKLGDMDKKERDEMLLAYKQTRIGLKQIGVITR